MKRTMETGRCGLWNVWALGVVAVVMATGAGGQTTNAWVPAGNGTWNTDSNWDPATFPNAVDAVAIFTNDYTANFLVTLTGDVTLNKLIFNDAGASDTNRMEITGHSLTFAGDAPSISNANSGSGHFWIHSTTVVNGVTLNYNGANLQLEMRGPVVGNGDIMASGRSLELWGVNSNFTGKIVVTNTGTSVGYLDGRGGNAGGYWAFGDTNEATYVYGTSFVRVMRDTVGGSNAEPIHVYGVSPNGSVRFYANTRCTYLGAITLHTNGVVNYSQWFTEALAPVGERKDFYFDGTIQDEGAGWNLHLLNDTGSSGSSSGTLSRTSRMVFSGLATHGGFTHVSNSRNPDGDGTQYSGWLQLTNGNDRLPVGTTLYLGGTTNSGTTSIGSRGANGVLILAGANQELSGLVVLGTGSDSRVIGGAPTNNTLTLNIAGGVTNLYGGYLGGAGADENNLALTKKGTGLLNLANNSTFTGPTTVEAGTLRIGGAHVGTITVQGGTVQLDGAHAGTTTVKTGGALNVDGTHTLGLITVENGGTLGGIGTVGAIASSGTVAPGNSFGTLTANGNVTLGAGATLLIDIDEFLNDEYDKLVLAGGAGNNTLNLTGSPNLTLNLNYIPGIGDYFVIVSGFADFIPFMDGAFSGKPDGGTFDVSGTTFQIDYNQNDIKLTVVPEPQTLGLLGLAALGGLLRRRIRR